MELSLLDIKAKASARIIRLDGGSEFQRKLMSLNIRPGKIVKKISSQPLGGPIVVGIGNTKVTLGRSMASRIIVEECS